MTHTLTAISPVDGRYAGKTELLSPYFSESALIRYRVVMEIKYLLDLLPLVTGGQSVPEEDRDKITGIATSFGLEQARRVKDIERATNHDVKAVEYFIREELEKLGLQRYSEWVHFGLTSQDVNNTSVPLSVKEAVQAVYLPLLDKLITGLKALASEWKDIPMLARTHGQPASPTRLGKEIWVFVERLEGQKQQLISIPHAAKFGGATGNFNAHYAAFPDENWVQFGNRFVNQTLGLQRSQFTTQIEHYDNLAALFHAMARINTIILDLNRDLWTYISMDYFKQKIKAGEVGSSAMPHKVNPIDFENSEGNIGLANALFEHLAAKLPVSRLQRDLTDSTVLRNVGVPFAHTVIAIEATLKGMGKLLLNEAAIARDLENNWAVVAEAIQTILRREGYPNPYDALKGLTRTNQTITAESLHSFIDTLDVDAKIKAELKSFSPQNYTGVQLL